MHPFLIFLFTFLLLPLNKNTQKINVYVTEIQVQFSSTITFWNGLFVRRKRKKYMPWRIVNVHFELLMPRSSRRCGSQCEFIDLTAMKNAYVTLKITKIIVGFSALKMNFLRISRTINSTKIFHYHKASTSAMNSSSLFSSAKFSIAVTPAIILQIYAFSLTSISTKMDLATLSISSRINRFLLMKAGLCMEITMAMSLTVAKKWSLSYSFEAGRQTRIFSTSLLTFHTELTVRMWVIAIKL